VAGEQKKRTRIAWSGAEESTRPRVQAREPVELARGNLGETLCASVIIKSIVRNARRARVEIRRRGEGGGRGERFTGGLGLSGLGDKNEEIRDF